LLCQRHQLPLAGDLIMLAHADEESDFTYGMAWLVREHRDLLDAPFALYEGGAELSIAGQPFCLVDTAEKGWATVEVVLRGSGGHSSIPHPNNPLYHIAPLLHRLATHKLPVHRIDTVSQLFAGIGTALASTAPTPAAHFQRMVDPAVAETVIPDLPVDAYLRHRFDALLRSTATPTMLTSGINRWTLPTEARLTLNGRLLPGQTGEDFDRELRAVVWPEFEYTIRDVHLGAECPRDTPLFDAIRRVVGRHTPAAAVLPNMMTGGTERGLLQGLGIQVYGFCPLREVPGQPAPFSLAHAPDERISVANLVDNCRSLFEVVCAMNNLEVPA
jgi:acetylornithine deacetylase/succinyl-diaminopimelate desuccinylase-like protein